MVKNGNKIFGLSNEKNGIPFTEVGKTAGGQVCGWAVHGIRSSAWGLASWTCLLDIQVEMSSRQLDKKLLSRVVGGRKINSRSGEWDGGA